MSDWIPNASCVGNVVRVPRIATKMIQTAKGGFFQVQDKRGKLYTVDTVPSHAKKTDSDLIQKSGVCFPVRNAPKGK